MSDYSHKRQLFTVISFILTYAIIWTFVSFFLDPSVPYDAVEALNWARNAEFGSPKNPYIVGNVMAIGLNLEPLIPLTLFWYLSHFAAVAIGILGIWLLSQRLFGENEIALIALFGLNLSGIINFDIIPYNDNYLLIMLWPYIFLFFIKAIYDNNYYWLPLAFVSGLAAMSKYSTFAFFPFLLIYTFLVPKARQAYKSAMPYLSIILFLLMLVPNCVWLFKHDFAALSWVQSQIKFGINFDAITAFMSVFYPVIILYLVLKFSGGKLSFPYSEEKKAVLFVFIQPILLIFIFFLFHKGGRITEWLQPFAILMTVVLLLFVDAKEVRHLRQIAAVLLTIAIPVCGGYAMVMINNIHGAGSKYSYMKQVGIEINGLWREKYHRPLKYVGGSEFAQWLTFYAPDHPEIFTRWSNFKKPNIYNAHLTTRNVIDNGVLIIGDINKEPDSNKIVETILDYQHLNLSQPQDFFFNNKEGQPLRLSLIFSPPNKSLLTKITQRIKGKTQRTEE